MLFAPLSPVLFKNKKGKSQSRDKNKSSKTDWYVYGGLAVGLLLVGLLISLLVYFVGCDHSKFPPHTPIQLNKKVL